MENIKQLIKDFLEGKIDIIEFKELCNKDDSIYDFLQKIIDNIKTNNGIIEEYPFPSDISPEGIHYSDEEISYLLQPETDPSLKYGCPPHYNSVKQMLNYEWNSFTTNVRTASGALEFFNKVLVIYYQIDKTIIPTEKYLAKMVENEEIEALEAKFEEVIDGKSLKQELEANIKEECKCAGLEISDEELAKRVKNDKKDFLEKKIAKAKFEKLKEEKIQEILKNPEKYPKIANLQDIDLVTEDYQNWAEQKYKAQYSKLEKDANLSFFDKTMRLMGFETKKTKALDKAQKAFKKEKGLERLKEKSPEIFEDQAKKIRSFIDAYQKESEKVFSNKKFWLSLLVNLFMVTASCYALNWMHPRVNKWIENKRAEKEANSQQKVEVK